jgi:hypothetical protein
VFCLGPVSDSDLSTYVSLIAGIKGIYSMLGLFVEMEVLLTFCPSWPQMADPPNFLLLSAWIAGVCYYSRLRQDS